MNLTEPKKIRGIIFDLDGTLYKLQWFMKPLLTLWMLPWIQRLPVFMRIRNTFAGKEMTNCEKLKYAIAEELARKSFCNNADSALNWINNRFYPAFIKSMPLFRGSRPGLIKTLETLKSRHYKLAVLSDFNYVKERLHGLAISPDLFDRLSSAEAEGALKPSPTPFIKIARLWQCQPAEIVVIGDRTDTDGQAAFRAQMQFWKIGDKPREDLDTYSWPSLKDKLLNLPSAK